MSIFDTYKPAIPITDEDATELRTEGLGELVVKINGSLYCSEDLYICMDCGMKTPDCGDLDDDGLCETCSSEICDEIDHMRQLRSDYYASIL